MASKFKAGDVVQLKSGGPKMTIARVESSGSEYFCQWFKGASNEHAYFGENVLMLFEDQKK